MVVISKIQNKFAGYLLLESLVSLILVGILIAIILPSFVLFSQQQKKRSQQLEVYRFSYELAQTKLDKEQEMRIEKKTKELLLIGKITTDSKGIEKLEVELEGENYVFELLSKP